jgi:hypothetical protein
MINLNKIISVTKNYSVPENIFDSYIVELENENPVHVPLDEANSDYQEILEWVENGGIIVDNGA